jgi:hypothetical protein
VRDRLGAALLGHAYEVTGDQRPRQRRHERVLAHVQGVGGDGGRHELVGELRAGVDDDGLGGAARQRPAAHLVQRAGARLADVDRAGDDLVALVLGQPADGHGRVEAAGVGEDGGAAHD